VVTRPHLNDVDVALPQHPVPLFPLPGVFLFPHQVLPLHVFEPRYIAMVEDLLDRAGRLVIGTTIVGEASPPGQPPAVAPVAGLGEILRHEKLPDGRYSVWLLGLARTRIREIESDRPYRQVACEPFIEIAVPEPEAEELARRLRAAAAKRLERPLPLPESTPPTLLADLLLQTLRAPQALLEQAFSEPSVARRARLALRAARARADGGDPPGGAAESDA
jgi:uncharacterized protein